MPSAKHHHFRLKPFSAAKCRHITNNAGTTSRIIETSILFDIYPAFLYVDFNRYLFDLPTAYYITLSQKTVYAYHFFVEM